MFLFSFHLHSCSIRLLHSTRHNLEKYLFHEHGDEKIFKNSKTKNRPVHTLSSSPITTTFASYSRSFAILLACCERRRLRFNTLHPFPTIPLRLSGRDEYFLRPMLLFFPGRATDDVQNTRAVTLLLDIACS